MLKLQGKSNKGKNLIRFHGEQWTVLDKKDRVIFSTEKGPWLFIIPVNGEEKSSRWIHSTNDINFIIVSG